ncbi:MAG: hypothetical protein HYW33_03455 [Candidatus Blackburnbacteria bacterium]|nr:hypothetical protein [Candidatus Blackburnbacteria bacterium]
MRQQLTFPTILGLLVLIVGVAVGVFSVQSRQTLTSLASPDETPSDIKITNITDKSFTVSWTTTKKTDGFVAYGAGESLGQTAQGGNTTSTHSAEISSLSPLTVYYFKIISGQNTFDLNGKAYQIKTGPKLATQTKTDVVFGTILDTLGKPVEKAVVILNVSGASPLSTQTDSKGTWVVPLSSLRISTLNGYANYSGKTTLEIFILGNAKVSQARLLVENAHPVPAITLGKNYNFTEVKSPNSTTLPKASLELAAVSITPQVSLTPTKTPSFTPDKVTTSTPTPAVGTRLPNVGDLTPIALLTIMGLSLVSSGFLLAKLIT